MTSTTTIQSLPLMSPSQAQKTVTHNQAIAQLDAMVQLAAADRDQTAPPAAPATGEVHLVAASATGAWAGMDNQVALWDGSAWEFYQPLTGWRAYVTAEDAVAVYDGTLWLTSAQKPQAFPRLGVNSSSDTTNRLSVKGDASLFQADTAGHQLKVNKNTAGDTASVVFQQGYAAHAEIGLVGDNDLSVKVSPDGTNFAQAFVVDSTSGKLGAKQGLNLAPSASDPAISVDGDLWYNSTTATFRARQGGLTVDLGSGGGGGSSLFSSAAFTLQDGTDATKQAQFDLTGLPTAATQRYGLPPMGSTLAVHAFFTTRADALAWMATDLTPDGTIISIAGFAYRKATAFGIIPDMADWIPALEVYADHFGENTVPGTTDMTTAIQTALDYVGYIGGGVVKLWIGTYVAAGLSIDSQTFLVGQGIDATTLKLRDGANTWLLATTNFVTNSTWANTYGGVRDLTFDGNKLNNPSGSLVWFASYRAKFLGARFANSGGSGLVLTAIMSDGTTMLANNMAENEIRNCHFDKNALHGVHAYDGAANRVSDAEVMHCHMNSNGGAGVYAERCAGWKITHNQIYASGTHGIWVHEFARAVIQGNHLDLNPTGAAAGSRNACIYVDSFSTQGAWVLANNIFLMDANADSSTRAMNGLAIMQGTSYPGLVNANTFVDLTAAQAAEALYIDPAATSSLAAVEWAVTAVGPNRVLHRNEIDLVLEDSTDPTKQAGLDASGITTGTKRTYSLPDASGTLALLSDITASAVADADYGDIIVSGGGTVWSIDYVAVNATIAPAWANITGIPAPVSSLSGTNTGDQTITLTGDVTGSGTGSFAATLAATIGGAKTFTGGVTLTDTVDTTKRITFDASGITAATTRTFSLPDVDGEVLVKDGSNVIAGSVEFDGGLTVGTGGGFYIYNPADSFYGTLTLATLATANRAWTLPDKDGTVALLSDVTARTPQVTSSITAPSSPAVGDIWIDMN